MMQDQTHKATKCNVVLAGLAKYPVPGQKNIKGSSREFHQKRNSNACINVTAEWGGGPRVYVGHYHLTSIALPILGNLTENLGPRVGTFAFFCT